MILGTVITATTNTEDRNKHYYVCIISIKHLKTGIQETPKTLFMLNIKAKFTIEQATKAQRGSSTIALIFL